MRVSTDIAEHPKSLLLEAELGERNAWAYMVRIWGWLTEYQDDGHIPALLAAIVERRAGWGGEPGKLLAAAEKVGFLDVDLVRGGWLAHNWNERNGAAISKAKIDAKRKRAAYESAKAASIQAEEKTSAILAGEKRGDSAEKAARKRGEKSASRGYGTGRDGTGPDVTKDSLKETHVGKAAAAEDVFSHWVKAMGKTAGALFNDKRKAAVLARLGEGYSAEQLKLAVDGCALTPHNLGKNERGERYDDLELICRNGVQVERFIQNAKSPPSPKSVSLFDRNWAKGRVGAEESDELKLAAGDQTSGF